MNDDSGSSEDGTESGEGSGGGSAMAFGTSARAPTAILTLDRIASFFGEIRESIGLRLSRIGPALTQLVRHGGGSDQAAQNVQDLVDTAQSAGLPPDIAADCMGVAALLAGESGAAREVGVEPGSAMMRYNIMMAERAYRLPPETLISLRPVSQGQREFDAFIYNLNTLQPLDPALEPGAPGYDAEILIRLNQTRNIAGLRLRTAEANGQSGEDITTLTDIMGQAESMLSEAHSELQQNPEAYAFIMSYLNERRKQQQQLLTPTPQTGTPPGTPAAGGAPTKR